MHVVDTLILPLLFSVFLLALGYLGWKDLQAERRRRRAPPEAKGDPKGGDSPAGTTGSGETTTKAGEQ